MKREKNGMALLILMSCALMAIAACSDNDDEAIVYASPLRAVIIGMNYVLIKSQILKTYQYTILLLNQ